MLNVEDLLKSAAIFLTAINLGGCAVGFIANAGAASVMNSNLSSNDKQLKELCDTYVRDGKSLQIDLTTGVRTYSGKEGYSVCPEACKVAFSDGFKFVEVVYVDNIFSGVPQIIRTERVTPSVHKDGPCLKGQAWARSYNKGGDDCYDSSVIPKPTAPIEAISVRKKREFGRPVWSPDHPKWYGDVYAHEGFRAIALPTRIVGELRGRFLGYRHLETGDVFGEGSFQLDAEPLTPNSGASVVASCADAA